MTRAANGDQGSCIACGAVAWTPLYKALRDYLTGEEFEIVRCGECGLGVTLPAPPSSELLRFYPQQYRGNRHAGTGSFRTRRRARAVAKHFTPGFRGRLLDLGAGAGDFALHMRERGWDVSATEIDAAAIEKLRQRGVDARPPAETGAPDWERRFDAITCWHVLEHVSDPPALLEQMRRALALGGVFQVTVPSISSWQARLMGRHWFHLDVPRHLFHFTPGALNRILGRHGFRVMSRSTFALEYDLFGAIQSPLNALLPRQNVLFDSLTRAHGKRPVAQVAASVVLAPLIGAVTVMPVLASWPTGAGATLTCTCRAVDVGDMPNTQLAMKET